jgi:hypothetical protein
MKPIFLLLLVAIFLSVEGSIWDKFKSPYICLFITVFFDCIMLLVELKKALPILFRERRCFRHPGKTKCEEQKRETRKAYEEICSSLGKRFCRKYFTWKDFQQWGIGGWYESKRNPLPTEATTPQIQTTGTYRTRLDTPTTLSKHKTELYRYPLPTQATTSQIQTMGTYRTRLDTPTTLPKHKTPLYGPVTKRQNYRTPLYRNEVVTRNPFD